jgi:endonuclease III
MHQTTSSRRRKTVGRKTVRRKAERITRLLHTMYGSPRHGSKEDPLDELVFVILSQMTTHHSFNRVFDRLKQGSGSWDRVLRMPLDQLKEVIKDAGLSNQKAPRIKAILDKVKKDFGRGSLDGLRDLPDRDVEQYLTSLPGVGIKTAKCVMMYSLGRQVLPVDTHVWRVARRLGLVDWSVPYTRVHEALEAAIPRPYRYAFHVNVVSHGRRLCIAGKPRCSECPLIKSCDYAKGLIIPIIGTN